MKYLPHWIQDGGPSNLGGGASIRGFERVDQKLVQENRPVVEVAIMERFSIRGFE